MQENDSVKNMVDLVGSDRLQEAVPSKGNEQAVRLVPPRTDAQAQAYARILADEVIAAMRDLESSLTSEQAIAERRGRAWSPDTQTS